MLEPNDLEALAKSTVQTVNQILYHFEDAELTLYRNRMMPSGLHSAKDLQNLLQRVRFFSPTHPELRALLPGLAGLEEVYDGYLALGYIFPLDVLLRDSIKTAEISEEGILFVNENDDRKIQFGLDSTVRILTENELSNDEEPSIFSPDAAFYLLDNELHRDDGLPAVISHDGSYEEFWIHGKMVSSKKKTARKTRSDKKRAPRRGRAKTVMLPTLPRPVEMEVVSAAQRQSSESPQAAAERPGEAGKEGASSGRHKNLSRTRKRLS